jgi:hypothetical protein
MAMRACRRGSHIYSSSDAYCFVEMRPGCHYWAADVCSWVVQQAPLCLQAAGQLRVALWLQHDSHPGGHGT